MWAPATQFSRRNLPHFKLLLPRGSQMSTNVLRDSASKQRLAVIALAPVFAVALLAQQTPAPPQSPQPQPQAQGRGQGRGPGAGGGRRGAPPQRDVTTPAGTGAIAGRVVAADTGRALRHA